MKINVRKVLFGLIIITTLGLTLMLGYIGVELYKYSQTIDELIKQTSCEKVKFFIKDVRFNINKNKYPYYVLEYDNKEYFYSIIDISKNTPNTIDLYFLEHNNWIYNQDLIINKCEK